ncbi:histidine kinase DhkL-like, partial [Schistosoma mansoni]|uniref:histidine kinase DhkL-like n=1 Tax=Schistosoma mansoni TaxID=6183 RepID=UPI00022C8660
GGQEINSRSLCNTIHKSSVDNNNNNNSNDNNNSSSWEYNHLITTDQTSSSFLHPTSITQSSGYLATTLSSSLSSNGNDINNNLCDALQSSTCTIDGNAIGYINTIVNSGTSTFRRRQSEYFKKSLDSTISSGNVCSSPPPPAPPLSPSSVKNFNYASVTPGLIRRGSQVGLN